MLNQTSQFAQRLSEWLASADVTQRQLAAQIGCHESLISAIRSGGRVATADFMSKAIARAPEPWKSALKQARIVDLDAADAAVAVA
jgi:transcriptional regulator with XRE-family HTH domain